MKVKFPPVRYIENVKEGIIIKEILRAEEIEVTIKKEKSNGNLYYIIRHSGNDIIVFLETSSAVLSKKYNYIIKQGQAAAKETSQLVDLSDFTWVKHPLLKTTFRNKFTRDTVLASWKNTFTIKTDEENQKGLRVPQLGAIYALHAHWTISEEAAIVVMPTGTGKTDTMVTSLIMSKFNCLLVIVPSDALRNQLALKFLTLGILPVSKMVTTDCESPVIGIIQHSFKTEERAAVFFKHVNVAVATINVLSACLPSIQEKIARLVSHFFIDEAHHTPADTWKALRHKFDKSKIVLFTATPFRNDGKRLEGKIVYNFPLRRAQELDYFRPIHFKPVHEHIPREADKLIAQKAVKQLAADLAAGYDHIAMVRVNSIARGEEIFEYYAAFEEYAPVLVHSQIKPKSKRNQILKNIIAKKHRIIICVDMLGEGFDLPELKIAAFHDTKKSLTITLQLAGRFTRVRPDLGPATFIANIADPDVNDDLEDLYYRDSDWNILLPDMSFQMSLEQEDFRKFLEGFKGFPGNFPIQSIKHPLSTIIFSAKESNWTPLSYKEGIKGIDNFQYTYSDYNKEQDILILILGKRSIVKWARIQDFESVDWDIMICYFDKATRLLYVHASNTNSYYPFFADAICKGAELVKGEVIFRCFAGINRIRLHNVGVRQPMGRAMNYIMRVGSDIRTALKDTEIGKAIKSNIFGVGYEGGARVSIGCSHHGRLWSMRSNTIQAWVKWCRHISKKVMDPANDPDIILKGTLIPKEIIVMPDCKAFAIDWPDYIYRQEVGSFDILYKNETYPIWNCDIELKNQGNASLTFNIVLPSSAHEFTLKIYRDGNKNKYDFTSGSNLTISDEGQLTSMIDLFTEKPPLIYFTDGSFLEGNLHTEIKHLIPAFTVEKFDHHDWAGVNIRKESQTWEKYTDSIQFSLLQKLKQDNKYCLLMDDDGKGEIGDIVGFQVLEKERILSVDVYHCKYSSEKTPGMRLADFYEVCGQAQRSIKWMEHVEEIFRQLARRSADRYRKHQVTRYEIGDEVMLDLLKRRAKKDLKVRMNIYIVQPGLAFSDYDENGEISKLLAVVETFLHETWNATLRVIANE